MARLAGLCDGGDLMSLTRRRESKVGPGSVGLANVTVFDRRVAGVFCIGAAPGVYWRRTKKRRTARRGPGHAALSQYQSIFLSAPGAAGFLCAQRDKKPKTKKKRKTFSSRRFYLSFLCWRDALCGASKKLPPPSFFVAALLLFFPSRGPGSKKEDGRTHLFLDRLFALIRRFFSATAAAAVLVVRQLKTRKKAAPIFSHKLSRPFFALSSLNFLYRTSAGVFLYSDAKETGPRKQ